jgi:hypothetical protein
MSRSSNISSLGAYIPGFVLRAFCALPFPLVALVAGAGFSHVDAPTAEFLRAMPQLAIGGFIVSFFAYSLVLRIANPFAFATVGSLVVMALIAGAMHAGLRYHRDFFSAAFTDLPVALCLLLGWARSRPAGTLKPQVLRAMGGAGYVIFGVFAVWILMMGYAISTRAEPRPIESIIYNCYNAALAFLLLLLSRGVVLKSKRTLVVSSTGINLDDAPIEDVLGTTEMAMLRAFIAAPGGRLSCADFQASMEKSNPERKRKHDCASCDPSVSKAADCPGYRSTYNRVLVIKRLLEFLEIGTILPPKKKLQILSDGWRFLSFENVKIKANK